FQAEDGIRDFHVTGVQTCALPILDRDWRDWIRHALDNPGSYPYEATAHVVGEAVARDAVPGLLARVDRERDTVMNRAVDEQPPQDRKSVVEGKGVGSGGPRRLETT